MAQYIDKSDVVAEIERLQDSIKATAIDDRISKEQAEAYKVCVKLRSFVEDTLEVKEVDVDKEARHYLVYEHESPLFRILHEIDLLIEMQYHRDIENAFKAGCELGIRGRATKTSEFLKKHFEETPQEELDKEWKEIEPLNNIGPDVLKLKKDN